MSGSSKDAAGGESDAGAGAPAGSTPVVIDDMETTSAERAETSEELMPLNLVKQSSVDPILNEQEKIRKILRDLSKTLVDSSTESEALYAEISPQLKRAALVARELLQDLENIGERIRVLKKTLRAAAQAQSS